MFIGYGIPQCLHPGKNGLLGLALLSQISDERADGTQSLVIVFAAVPLS
jgi:hypothetical protein